MQNLETIMTKSDIEKGIAELFQATPGNCVREEEAISPELAGIRLFDAPIVGIGAAEDPLFEELKKEGAVGPWYLGPKDWFPEARTVVSLFFPFTEEVRASIRICTDGPSPLWVHGRIEGQNYMVGLMKEFCRWLEEQGVGTCFPAGDPRMKSIVAGNNLREYSCVDEKTFGSNWSERHTAFICGLGTFGLSRGLISRKGIAGRYMSVILDAEIQPDERPYTDLYEYCSRCGACIRRCPGQAISREGYNNLTICNMQNDIYRKQYAPRYGCGLCQTKVPCESRIPVQK